MQKVPLEALEDELVKRKAKEIKAGAGSENQYRQLARAIAESAKKQGAQTATLYRVDGVPSSSWSILGTGDTFTPEQLLQEARDTFGEELKTEVQNASSQRLEDLHAVHAHRIG